MKLLYQARRGPGGAGEALNTDCLEMAQMRKDRGLWSRGRY